MAFVGFFAKKKVTVISLLDNQIDQQEPDERTADQIPNTILAYTPEQLQELSSEDLTYYKELNDRMPVLVFDEINFIPIEVGILSDGGYYLRVFIRNGSEETFSLEGLLLHLLDADKDVVASQTFQTPNFGEIRLGETRLWSFEFSKDNILKQEVDLSSYDIQIDSSEVTYKRALELDMPESWQKNFTTDQLKSLETTIQRLPMVASNRINISGLKARVESGNNLRVMLVMQNTTANDVKIDTLPLKVKDNLGDLVAEGSFQLEDFIIKAQTAKPWMFIFDSKLVKKSNPDFSRWIVYTE